MNMFKNICHKIASVLEWLVGIAFGACLFVGGLGFFGFLVALCIGGDTATEICTWLYKCFYGVLIKIGTVSTLVSFLIIYLKGDANWINPFKTHKSEEDKSVQS